MSYAVLEGKSFELKQPYRKTVKDLFTIAYENVDLERESRLKYAREAGIEPQQTEDGKVYELKNTYNAYNAVPAMAKVLFVDFPLNVNDDDINEGEVNRAFMDFIKRRSGIIIWRFRC